MATRDTTRERFWRDTFTAWKAGGLTAREYCAPHGLTAAAFHHWRRELRRRDAAAPPRPSVPKFVPVTVRPAPTVAVEVRCPSGHVVTLPAAEPAALRTLFAALALVGEEEKCRCGAANDSGEIVRHKTVQSRVTGWEIAPHPAAGGTEVYADMEQWAEIRHRVLTEKVGRYEA